MDISGENLEVVHLALEAAIFENKTTIRFGGYQTEILDARLKKYETLLKSVKKELKKEYKKNGQGLIKTL